MVIFQLGGEVLASCGSGSSCQVCSGSGTGSGLKQFCQILQDGRVSFVVFPWRSSAKYPYSPPLSCTCTMCMYFQNHGNITSYCSMLFNGTTTPLFQLSLCVMLLLYSSQESYISECLHYAWLLHSCEDACSEDHQQSPQCGEEAHPLPSFTSCQDAILPDC